MDEIINNIISVVVTVVVIPLITLLGTNLIQWIGTKTANEKAAKILSEASTIIINSVKTVFQTYVDTLKKSGKFDSEAQIEALQRAKTTALAQLKNETQEYIKANYGSVDIWLVTQIEATIDTLKNN
jgi:uncharacterized membrane protein